MMDERPEASAEKPSDELYPPRSFPVPRNRPVFAPADGEEECEEHEGSWRRRALLISGLAALAALGVFAWLATKPAEPQPAAAPVVEARVPTSDPAVETYYAPSDPEHLPPLEEDRTPLPVAPVSLDALFGRDAPQ